MYKIDLISVLPSYHDNITRTQVYDPLANCAFLKILFV